VIISGEKMSKRFTENITTNPEDKSFRRMVFVILTIVFVFTLSSVVFELTTLLSNKIILLIAAGTTLVCLIFAIRGNSRPSQIMLVALIVINIFGGDNGVFDAGIR